MADEQNEEVSLKLDGSNGFGDKAYVTIITKDGVEEKEETLMFPYILIRGEVLQKFLDLKLILGYKITREIQETK